MAQSKTGRCGLACKDWGVCIDGCGVTVMGVLSLPISLHFTVAELEKPRQEEAVSARR